MEVSTRGSAPLVLLIDEDPVTRSVLRPLVLPHGLEVVQARRSLAALELLQRVAECFRLVVVSLDLSGLSGAVVLETLRLFKPALTTLCLTTVARAPAGGDGSCLLKPLRAHELRARIAEALAGAPVPAPGPGAGPEAVACARTAFALSASLLEAARELARGMPGESAVG